jgi:hypothetical protein
LKQPKVIALRWSGGMPAFLTCKLALIERVYHYIFAAMRVLLAVA